MGDTRGWGRAATATLRIARPADAAGWPELRAVLRRRIAAGWYDQPRVLDDVARRIAAAGTAALGG